METICIKCQILFSEKNKSQNNILSSAKLAKRVLKVINVGKDIKHQIIIVVGLSSATNYYYSFC